MKKFSSPATSSSNYRSLSLPKGRSGVTESTQDCHPEPIRQAQGKLRAKHVVEGSLVAVLIAILLTACGENTTTEKIVEVATGGTEIVSSVKDLPKCTKNNEGEQALVKGESSIRVCVDGKWFATKESAKDTVFMAGDTVYLDNGNYSCTTKELKDKSGLKIICNGDSIGVVLNGVNGKDGEKGDVGKEGKDGAGCTIVKQTDTSATIKCGDSTMTLNFRGGGASADTTSSDTLELDSEKVAISLDTLSGYSQKGPFLKGSSVLLYELSDGRTLKQMGNSFSSVITSNDGRYKFSSRDLTSQYALIEVDGKYRNEVSGNNTSSAIKLQAYTNMLMRKSANVNLLTHLEKDRVFYLVTKEKMTVRAAKKQAQAEILKAFHIDASQFKTESEDLDVFGKTDADAALLAISILLQRDSSETELSVLLTETADDLAEDGVWNNSAKKTEIADWVATVDSMVMDTASKLAKIRKNVRGWGLGGGNVPDFEKFVRRFWGKELGLGICGEGENKVGTVKNVSNKNSKRFYAKSFTDATNKVRFICDDASLFRWRAATDLEKDTYQWKAGEDGQIKNGDVNKARMYDYDGKLKMWRYATPQEGVLGGCTETREADISLNTGKYNGIWYICKNREWISTNNITVDTQGWAEGSDGDLKKGDSTNTFYKYDEASDSWVTATHRDSTLKLMGCTTNRTGIMGQSPNDNVYYVCKDLDWQVAQEIDYETYGEICTEDSVGKLINGVVTPTNQYYCSATGWLDVTEFNWNAPKEAYMNPNVKYGTVTDSRDQKIYKTVKIGNQVWLAENLNYSDSLKSPSLKGKSWCYNNLLANCNVAGRLYTWAAAIDSVKLYDNGNGILCGRGKMCDLPSAVQGVCPNDWRLPTKNDWKTLVGTLGDEDRAGIILKSRIGWVDNGNGSDSIGFSIMPAGIYEQRFSKAGWNAYYWTADESKSSMENGGNAYSVDISYDYAKIFIGVATGSKSWAYSVRCLKDAP